MKVAATNWGTIHVLEQFCHMRIAHHNLWIQVWRSNNCRWVNTISQLFMIATLMFLCYSRTTCLDGKVSEALQNAGQSFNLFYVQCTCLNVRMESWSCLHPNCVGSPGVPVVWSKMWYQNGPNSSNVTIQFAIHHIAKWIPLEFTILCVRFSSGFIFFCLEHRNSETPV
jgi:hypothetical protein